LEIINMSQDLKNFLTGFWHGILLFTLGVIFNTGIALLSVVFPIFAIAVPLFTGYGIYTLYKKLQTKATNDSQV